MSTPTATVDELQCVYRRRRIFLERSGSSVYARRVQKDLFSVGAQLADPGFKSSSAREISACPLSELPRWRMQSIVLKRNCRRCVNSSWRVEETAGPCFMWHGPFAGARSAGS